MNFAVDPWIAGAIVFCVLYAIGSVIKKRHK